VPTADHPFVAHVGARLSELIERGERAAGGSPANQCGMVVVALSGGPDSCALLAAVKSLVEHGGLRVSLRACHVNHRLRGQEAEEDELFCQQLCAHWKVPLHIERLSGDIRDEAGLRDARYAVLLAHAQDIGAHYVLTAHTKSDQVETFLFRLFRGSAPAGLVGIPAARALSDRVEVLRPLLAIERARVVDFLKSFGLNWRADSSNDLIDYGRNYIRNRVIPLIVQRFPGFARSIERLRTLLHEDELLLSQLTHEAHVQVVDGEHSWDRQKFNEQPLSLRRRLIASALRSRNIEVSFERTQDVIRLAARGQGAVTLDELWTVRCDEGSIEWFYRADDEAQPVDLGCEATLALPGLSIVPRLGVAVQVDEWTSADGAKRFPQASADEVLIDLSSIVQPLVVRTRKAGDTIRPFGMKPQVKLKKYLHTHKSDALINPRRVIVIADATEVLWVPGVGISEKVRVTSRPTHQLRFMHLAGDDTGIS
jgi:tRNA(Ile)-lysidine synthase